MREKSAKMIARATKRQRREIIKKYVEEVKSRSLMFRLKLAYQIIFKVG